MIRATVVAGPQLVKPTQSSPIRQAHRDIGTTPKLALDRELSPVHARQPITYEQTKLPPPFRSYFAGVTRLEGCRVGLQPFSGNP